jgi:RNA polymerase sigma-70 factor (ECF subfamily)
LEEQDRSRWDKALVNRGLFHLARSAEGEEMSELHLESAIAAVHARSPSPAATDWGAILGYYDALLALTASPVVAVQRAIAVGMAQGAEAGLRALDALLREPKLAGYCLLDAARGHFFAAAGRRVEAAEAYRLALARVTTDAERRFVEERLRRLQ